MSFITKRFGQFSQNSSAQKNSLHNVLEGRHEGRLDAIKGFVGRMKDPFQRGGQIYNEALVNTQTGAQNSFVPRFQPQQYHVNQPQYQKPMQIGIHRQSQIDFTKSYYKNRTDAVTIAGNEEVKKKDKFVEDLNYVFPDPFIRYKIIPAAQYKMALDVSTTDNDELQRGKVIIWDYHGGPNQNFYIRKVGSDNLFQIISASTGFVLQAPGQMELDQQLRVIPRAQQRQNEGRNEVWKLQQCGPDLFLIRSYCGRVLDVQHQFMRNGQAVIQYKQKDQKGGPNQKWRIWPS